VNNWVYAIACDSSNNVYAGGNFTTASGITANYIAKWSPATNTWSALGGGVNSTVISLKFDNSKNNLYVGGYFTTASGVTTNSIAKWNLASQTWSAVSVGTMGTAGTTGIALDSYNNVFVTGMFISSGFGISANSIISSNSLVQSLTLPPTWQGLGGGTNGSVNTVTRDSYNNVYVGGNFTYVNGGFYQANYLAKWIPSSTSWSFYGSGANAPVNSLVCDTSNNIYVGGQFTTLNGTTTNYVAFISSNSSILSLGGGLDASVNVLILDSSNNVYVGGNFRNASGLSANYIAKWNTGTNTWSSLGTGLNGSITSLTFDGSYSNLYAGGTFTNASGINANYVAKWNLASQTWSTVSPFFAGTNGNVNGLIIDSSNNFYATGNFTSAFGITANNIVSANIAIPYTLANGTWQNLGGGLDASVNVLISDSSNNLYAGGSFRNASGSSANYIAKWNQGTQTWSSLGGGLNAPVTSLYLDSLNNLYAGGTFTGASGLSANYFAKWNPTTNTWSTYGSGTGSPVNAIIVDSSYNLYTGGAFTSAGGTTANNIAIVPQLLFQ
jgi:hypothetical protein